jgi:SufS family cysteine desulfurase
MKITNEPEFRFGPGTKKDNRSDFPLFLQNIAYLDSASTSQKPKSVVDRMQRFYELENANVHRGVYKLSEQATLAFEGVRHQVASYLGGVANHEVIFTRGTTEGINLVAYSWGLNHLKQGDEIVVTVMEHHSNLVPWQLVAAKTGAKIRAIPLSEEGRIDLEEAGKIIGPQTKLLACGHVSNVLGCVNPVKTLVSMAKEYGAVTLIDGAQYVPHFEVDLKSLDCDFYAFSGHKMLGPTGIGVLYGREELLNRMPPFLGGGDMIERVTIEQSTWAGLPSKFEAGTPNIAGVIGLGAAIDYLCQIDRKSMLEKDLDLASGLLGELRARPNIRLFTSGDDPWLGIVTFYHEAIHPHDMAALADAEGVCIRAGHHCAQPLMHALGVPATSRISPYIYNNSEDIERFLAVLEKAEKLFL